MMNELTVKHTGIMCEPENSTLFFVTLETDTSIIEKKCKRLALYNNFSRFSIVNLGEYRLIVEALHRVQKVGSYNDIVLIYGTGTKAHRTNVAAKSQIANFWKLVNELNVNLNHIKPKCFGLSKAGKPLHITKVKYNQPLINLNGQIPIQYQYNFNSKEL